MKRNWDLVRELLLKLEEKSIEDHLSNDSKEIQELSTKYGDDAVTYHADILIEAGLIEGETAHPFGGGMNFLLTRLTWEGHEFLDKIRSENIWGKTVKILKDKGVELTLETIKMGAKLALQSVLGSEN